jgi:hypothetical protein
MLAISSAPAAAFTLASPSLAPPVAAGNVDHVWWDRWGRWHPNHPYGGPGWGWRPHRHCSRGATCTATTDTPPRLNATGPSPRSRFALLPDCGEKGPHKAQPSILAISASDTSKLAETF